MEKIHSEKFKEVIKQFLCYQIASKAMFHKLIYDRYSFADPEYEELNETEERAIFHFDGYDIECTIIYEPKGCGYKFIDLK